MTTSIPTLPLDAIAASNTGAASLPSPTSTPFVIAVGMGHQNYTCNGTAWVQSETKDGANATLFNVTRILDSSPASVANLSSQYLQVHPSGNTKRNCGGGTHQDAAALNWTVLGHHYFDYGLRPTFNLTGAGLPTRVLSAKKAGDVKAPNATAVDWLHLVDAGDGVTQNLQSVYRVETVGGVATGSCDSGNNQTFQSVPYAAEYWFYDS